MEGHSEIEGRVGTFYTEQACAMPEGDGEVEISEKQGNHEAKS